eukprot:TRINITY_DN12779_c0_g1_i1.p1 TRINITY_DN12779_c0_g1~~TRINITY_DN12779_c0_g1_i1.p1  ORF type:complete len:177 (-),score=46.35 TRINITY_DN12779_c0_g1_i1:60-590(-)
MGKEKTKQKIQNQSVQMPEITPIKKRENTVENMLWISIYFSVICCLMRTDFNVVFLFVCYYLWVTTEKKLEKANQLMILLGLLVIFDIIWIISVGGLWTITLKKSPVWNSFHNINLVILGFSGINIITKVSLIFMLWNLKHNRGGDDQEALMEKDNFKSNQAVSLHIIQELSLIHI